MKKNKRRKNNNNNNNKQKEREGSKVGKEAKELEVFKEEDKKETKTDLAELYQIALETKQENRSCNKQVTEIQIVAERYQTKWIEKKGRIRVQQIGHFSIDLVEQI